VLHPLVLLLCNKESSDSEWDTFHTENIWDNYDEITAEIVSNHIVLFQSLGWLKQATMNAIAFKDYEAFMLHCCIKLAYANNFYTERLKVWPNG